MNDLKNASNILDPIMFADDTNFFFTHKDIRYLFQIVNQELENINQCFVSNKLKNKPSQKENIPPLLPKLIINNYEIHTLVPRPLFRLPLITKRCAVDEVAKYNEQNQLILGGFYWMKI